jgi:hypothetical protein
MSSWRHCVRSSRVSDFRCWATVRGSRRGGDLQRGADRRRRRRRVRLRGARRRHVPPDGGNGQNGTMR